MSIMKIKRTVWLPADLDQLVVAEQRRLKADSPNLNVTYSDALRGLLARVRAG